MEANLGDNGLNNMELERFSAVGDAGFGREGAAFDLIAPGIRLAVVGAEVEGGRDAGFVADEGGGLAVVTGEVERGLLRAAGEIEDERAGGGGGVEGFGELGRRCGPSRGCLGGTADGQEREDENRFASH